MEQGEKREKNANEIRGASQEDVAGSTSNDRLNVEAASPTSVGRSRVQIGRVVSRLQAARKALRNPARSARSDRDALLSTRSESVSDVSVQADTLNIDVSRWVRRVLIPLAILA
ncbi:MAG TPA: hypothetical protein VKR83_10030, partial [Ktedonobacteraceae bacterium]|nr:hypothetical protein [Ktedonobacteraceae bacterium]